MSMDFEDMSKKKKKKFRRVSKSGFYAIGGGIGLFVIKFIFPNIEGDEQAKVLFNGLSLWLIIYGGLIVLTLVFKRDWMVRVNTVLVWFVTPAVLIKLFMDAV